MLVWMDYGREVTCNFVVNWQCDILWKIRNGDGWMSGLETCGMILFIYFTFFFFNQHDHWLMVAVTDEDVTIWKYEFTLGDDAYYDNMSQDDMEGEKIYRGKIVSREDAYGVS